MKTRFIATTAAAVFAAAAGIPGASTAQATADVANTQARLTDSQVLLTDSSPSKAKLAECQPLKGEIVAILEIRKNIEGMLGLDAARVQVLDGRCKGSQGWVGLSRLEKL